MDPWWTLMEGQRRPKAEASPCPQPPCPATLTRLASSPPATGTTSQGRCHSPGPRPPAAAPAWPAPPGSVRAAAAAEWPGAGGQLRPGGASGRSGAEHPARAAAPPLGRDWLPGGPAERARANGAAASGADARVPGPGAGGVRGPAGLSRGADPGTGRGAGLGRAFPGPEPGGGAGAGGRAPLGLSGGAALGAGRGLGRGALAGGVGAWLGFKWASPVPREPPRTPPRAGLEDGHPAPKEETRQPCGAWRQSPCGFVRVHMWGDCGPPSGPAPVAPTGRGNRAPRGAATRQGHRENPGLLRSAFAGLRPCHLAS